MAFRFENGKWWYKYDLATGGKGTFWENLLESKDPVLKRYVIFNSGFHYYADGICGANRWARLFIKDNVLGGDNGLQGWSTSKEAKEWLKANGLRNKSTKAVNEYGRGAGSDTYKVMRLDKYIKFITSDDAWYFRSTHNEPEFATLK